MGDENATPIVLTTSITLNLNKQQTSYILWHYQTKYDRDTMAVSLSLSLATAQEPRDKSR